MPYLASLKIGKIGTAGFWCHTWESYIWQCHIGATDLGIYSIAKVTAKVINFATFTVEASFGISFFFVPDRQTDVAKLEIFISFAIR